MRLRRRFAAETTDRLRKLAPEALGTAWDVAAVACAFEQLKPVSTGGFEGDWERQAQLTGVAVAELRADQSDQWNLAPLLADLVQRPILLGFDPAPRLAAMSEKARFVLYDIRDLMRGTQLVTQLRFSVEVTIAAWRGPLRLDPTQALPVEPDPGIILAAGGPA